MATIILGGQLQPTTIRRSTRQPSDRTSARTRHIREAARTREIRRVYRRRRLGATGAIVTLAVAAFFTVFSLLDSSAAANGNAGQSVAPRYVVAQPGDTLWSIGTRIAPNAAITEVVDELVRLNGTSIETGQLVRIP